MWNGTIPPSLLRKPTSLYTREARVSARLLPTRRGWRPRQPVKARVRCCAFRDVREAVPYGFVVYNGGVRSRYTDKLQSEAPHQSPSGDSFPRFTKKKAIAKRIGEALWDNVSFAFPKERCYGNEQIILGEGGGVADG